METKIKKLKDEITTVGSIHSERNRIKTIHGERVRVPLDDGCEIEAVIYRYSTDAPTLYTAFGGGFVMGGCALDDHMWISLSREMKANIISIGYRKAPEYKFPTALTDVYRAICWFTEYARKYQINPDKIGVMGASAGGNLAAAATILDRRYKTNYIRFLILNYPYLDLSTEPKDKGYEGDEDTLYQLFPELYLPVEVNRKDPLVSPVYTETELLKDFPETFITLAGNDPLYREGEKFGERINQAGGKAFMMIAEDMPHGYLETWFNLTDPEQDPDQVYISDNLKILYDNGKMESECKKICTFISEAVKHRFN